MTTPRHHDDGARTPAPVPAPGWAGAAYDPPPADPYRFTGPGPAQPGFGYPAQAYPAQAYPAQAYPGHAYPPAALHGTPTPPTGIAVLAAILFAPLGIWALVLAGQVNAKAAAGDIVGAMAAASKARTVAYVGIAAGSLLTLLFCFGACSAMSSPTYY